MKIAEPVCPVIDALTQLNELIQTIEGTGEITFAYKFPLKLHNEVSTNSFFLNFNIH